MNNNKGFSLLEILVAFSILAVSLGILLKIFSSGVNTAMVAEEYTMATQIAESLMAQTGVIEPVTAGNSRGTENEKYHWQINIENITSPVAGDEVEYMTVQVIVEWQAGQQNNRYIELNSLKPGPQE